MSKKSARQSATARAAAIRAERERAEKRRRWLAVGGVVGALVLVAGILFLVQSSRDSTGEAAVAPTGVNDDYGVVLGDPSAATTVTIYEDFLCPVCGVFEQATAEQLREAVDDGRIRLEYRMVTFLDHASDDEYSSRALNAAAVVLDAAGEEAFADFHDLLFAEQPAEGGPGLSDDRLVELAVQAGAEEAAVRPGIEDRVFHQWALNATDAMSRNGVTGTPTVLVDGERVEGESLEDVATQTLEAAA